MWSNGPPPEGSPAIQSCPWPMLLLLPDIEIVEIEPGRAPWPTPLRRHASRAGMKRDWRFGLTLDWRSVA